MNYAGINFNDVANGTGVRTSLFVSGCTHHCPGCFSKQTWDFDYGEPFTKEIRDMVIDSVSESYYKGLSILGGDPLEIQNTETVLDLVLKYRELYHNSKDIWLYTGSIYENILEYGTDLQKKILDQVDVLVDGPFIQSKKDPKLKFRGSSNQRIIYLKERRE